MPPKAKGLAERFWPKVKIGLPDECWLWTAAVTKTGGYGKIGAGGRARGWIKAHKAAWLIHYGTDVPEGLEIDHLCHNRLCVNPGHLEAVTHAENMKRMRSALATHCVRGHEYDGSRSANGRRFCRECSRFRDKNRKRRRAVRPPLIAATG